MFLIPPAYFCIKCFFICALQSSANVLMTLWFFLLKKTIPVEFQWKVLLKIVITLLFHQFPQQEETLSMSL